MVSSVIKLLILATCEAAVVAHACRGYAAGEKRLRQMLTGLYHSSVRCPIDKTVLCECLLWYLMSAMPIRQWSRREC